MLLSKILEQVYEMGKGISLRVIPDLNVLLKHLIHEICGKMECHNRRPLHCWRQVFSKQSMPKLFGEEQQDLY
jgi:hypothetical protein